jgi:hypothetical protein
VDNKTQVADLKRDRKKEKQRQEDRMKAVLPVRIMGEDAGGEDFEDLAHTLDLTSAGARLGAVRRELDPSTEITVFYHRCKMQFRVAWTRRLPGTSEYQVGLQSIPDADTVPWGLTEYASPKGLLARPLRRWSRLWTPRTA